jgi:hypothetical protein
MEERVDQVPGAKSWADEIDDLYFDATERNLRSIRGAPGRRPALEPHGTEVRMPGSGTGQHETAAGGASR